MQAMAESSSVAEGSLEGEAVWKDEDFLSFAAPEKAKSEKDAGSSSGSDMFLASSDDDDDDAADGTEGSDSLPPWMNRAVDYNRQHPMMALHNEIVAFCKLMEPLPDEIREREKMVLRFQDLAKKVFGEEADTKVFGSQATGLFLPSSDIDIVLLLPPEEDADKQKVEAAASPDIDIAEYNKRQNPLAYLADALRTEWKDELSYLEVIPSTKVPLVKFTHAATNLSVDVCFNQPNGPQAAQLMESFVRALPPLKPLTLILKYYLRSRSLHEPYSGGVGSYMLQLLIVSFLQQRERQAYHTYRPNGGMNLGALLMDFMDCYGYEFNFLTTGLSCRFDGYYFAKGAKSKKEHFYNENRRQLMALENPLDITQNVAAGSFRISMVQRAMAISYKQLVAATTEAVNDRRNAPPSILKSILPVSPEMEVRKNLQKLNRPLMSSRGDGSINRNGMRSRGRKRVRSR